MLNREFKNLFEAFGPYIGGEPRFFPGIGLSIDELAHNVIPPSLDAERVIFNPPATIVYWKDGSKTIVRCSNDEFSEEFGFAMACVRKLYGSRNNFKAQYENAQRQYLYADED